MKGFRVSISCFLLLAIFSVQAVKPVIPVDERGGGNNKKVNAKCHVALIDGNEIIQFWLTKPERLSKLANYIVGKKVMKQKSLEKVKIYKAYECVLEGHEFTSLKAQSLDKKTPR
jgi:hypothetical protein